MNTDRAIRWRQRLRGPRLHGNDHMARPSSTSLLTMSDSF